MKSARMKPVVRVAESREQEAAKALAVSQDALEAQRKQLADLVAYRDEYADYALKVGNAGVSIRRYQELQRFLDRLSEAIVAQQRQVQSAERNCEYSRRNWSKARGRTLALEKVVDRYRELEQLDALRREQKEIDEAAQRRGRGGLWKEKS